MQLNLVLLAVICVVAVHGATNGQRKNAINQPEHHVHRREIDWSFEDVDEDNSDGTTESTVNFPTTQSTTTEPTTEKASKKGSSRKGSSEGSSSKGSSSKGSSSKGSSSKGSSSKGSSSKGSSKKDKNYYGGYSENLKSHNEFDDDTVTPTATSTSTTTTPTTPSTIAISTSKRTTSTPITAYTSSTRRMASSTTKPYAIEKPNPRKTLAAAYIERQYRYMDKFESELSMSQFEMAYASLVELNRRIGPLVETLSALLGRECRYLWPFLSYDPSPLGSCKTSKKEAEAQLVEFENLLLLSRSYREGAESVKDLTTKMHEKYARAMKDSLRDLVHDGRPGDLPGLPASFPASAPSVNFFGRGQFGFQEPNPLPTETKVIALPLSGIGMDGTAPSLIDISLPGPDISDASTPAPDISNTYESPKYLDALPLPALQLPTTGSPKGTLTQTNTTDTTFEPSNATKLAETQESAPTIFGDYDYENHLVPGPATTLQEAQEELNKTLKEPIGNPSLFLVTSLLATIPDIYSQLSYIPPIINNVINSSSYRLQVTQQNRKYFLYVDSNLTMRATDASVDTAEFPVGSIWKFVPHKHNEVFLFFNVERRVIMGSQDAWAGRVFKSNSSFIAAPMPLAGDSENDDGIRSSFMWTLFLECDEPSNEVDSFGNDTCAPDNLYLAIQNSEFHNLKVTLDKDGQPILRNDKISPRIDVITVE